MSTPLLEAPELAITYFCLWPSDRLQAAEEKMPRFFFDVSYGGEHIIDSEGIDLVSAKNIPGEGYAVLRDIVHDKMPKGRFVLTVVVRNARGAIVYRGDMTVNGERLR